MIVVNFVVAVPLPWRLPASPPGRVSAQAPQPDQRPPVFRAGAHYVRVDAYPTKNGRIIEGLTRDDFEIYEDGTRQAIEQADFVTFSAWTPDAERVDPRSPQHAYDLAADPTWRVFVIIIDRAAYGMQGQHYMRGPLHEFLDRTLGPRDLFGILTTESEWTDLTLGQTTTAAKRLIAQFSRPPAAPAPVAPASSPGPAALVGEAVAYRLAPRQAREKVSIAEYARTDRMRVEWPLLGTVEHRAIRMLDRNGKPLPVDLPSAEDEPARAIVVELSRAAFARGDYWLELTAAANGTSERRVLPLKVK